MIPAAEALRSTPFARPLTFAFKPTIFSRILEFWSYITQRLYISPYKILKLSYAFPIKMSYLPLRKDDIPNARELYPMKLFSSSISLLLFPGINITCIQTEAKYIDSY